MEKRRRSKRIWSRRAPHPLCLPTNLRFAGEISRLLVYAPLRGLRRPAIGTGMYFSVSHRPSIQHGRSAPSHRAAFSGPVFRGCALRFAPCARHFSPSGLHLFASICIHSSQSSICNFAPCRLRRPGVPWLRTALRSVCSPLQPFGSQTLASSLAALVAHWAYYALFRSQSARFVRPAKMPEMTYTPLFLIRVSFSEALSIL